MNNKLGSESKSSKKKSRFWKGIDNNEYVTDLTGNFSKILFYSKFIYTSQMFIKKSSKTSCFCKT